MPGIILKADINECKVENWQTNTGEVNARELKVEMCEDLSNSDKQFVTFELADGTVYESLVVDGKANIPEFSESQYIKVGLYSVDVEGEECKKRYSSNPDQVLVNVGSYKDGSVKPPIPTPGDYAELLDQIAGVKKDTAESLADLEKGTIKSVENVKLWELETGYYYISGTLDVSKTEQVTYNKPHLYIVYKLFENQVRYIHLCADSVAMDWSQIEVGYSSDNVVGHKEYHLMDTSKLVNEINKYSKDYQFPSAKSVYDYVQGVTEQSQTEIENIKVELQGDLDEKADKTELEALRTEIMGDLDDVSDLIGGVTLSDQLYKFYGVSPTEYPYVFIEYVKNIMGNSLLKVSFVSTYTEREKDVVFEGNSFIGSKLSKMDDLDTTPDGIVQYCIENISVTEQVATPTAYVLDILCTNATLDGTFGGTVYNLG